MAFPGRERYEAPRVLRSITRERIVTGCLTGPPRLRRWYFELLVNWYFVAGPPAERGRKP